VIIRARLIERRNPIGGYNYTLIIDGETILSDKSLQDCLMEKSRRRIGLFVFVRG
jgi:hypothetical protein